jgi:DNA-binding NtrC family response regulator
MAMTKKKGKILVVDDNTEILISLNLLLKHEFEIIVTINDPKQIPEKIQHENFDVILLDMNFTTGNNSGNEGFYWLKEILKSDKEAIIIMITAYGDIEMAVRAIKGGATDFISKPWDAEKLIITIKNSVELKESKNQLMRLKEKQKQLAEDTDKRFQLYIGPSKTMHDIYKTIDKVADTDANVLILGENGTGKEVVAREIHRLSKRSSDIFMAVDMGSLSESLFESEIFGHMKGAFTDAKEDRAGRFETASGGTLFLDEIGNLSMAMQTKLLTVLQNRQVVRIGSNKPIPIDIRLITATNKSLDTMVQQNLFRQDLLYRINTIQIEVPSLRNRKKDIPGLADYFLSFYATKYEKLKLKFNGAAYDKLCEYTWPGNIRELKHTIEKSVILCESDIIKPGDLFLRETLLKTEGEISNYKLSDIEKQTVETVLAKCHGNYSKAAQMLDISRTTLYAKIEKYNL